MVSVSGYLIGSQEAGRMPLPPQAEFECGINSISPRSGRAGTKNTPSFEADLATGFAQVGFAMHIRPPALPRSTIRIMSTITIHNYRWR